MVIEELDEHDRNVGRPRSRGQRGRDRRATAQRRTVVAVACRELPVVQAPGPARRAPRACARRLAAPPAPDRGPRDRSAVPTCQPASGACRAPRPPAPAPLGPKRCAHRQVCEVREVRPRTRRYGFRFRVRYGESTWQAVLMRGTERGVATAWMRSPSRRANHARGVPEPTDPAGDPVGGAAPTVPPASPPWPPAPPAPDVPAPRRRSSGLAHHHHARHRARGVRGRRRHLGLRASPRLRPVPPRRRRSRFPAHQRARRGVVQAERRRCTSCSCASAAT